MISPKSFYEILADEGVGFFSGVPDSLLKEFCAYVEAVVPPESHIIAANEGSAVALASGFYLATGKIPMVYMQNSGLGNAVNPILSLTDKSVYSLPMIVLVGWRGAPGVRDEPQHMKQGRVTPALLEALEIPWRQLDGDPHAATEAAKWAAETARHRGGPVVLLTHNGAFGKAETRNQGLRIEGAVLSRESAISLITSQLLPKTVVVSTTGMISRELYEQRTALGQNRSLDFLTVGSMGHASQIALGIATARPELDVACLDGDGSVLMHMGGLATIGSSKVGNLFHIVMNNGVHDSVGGQPTAAQRVSLTEVAKACCYGAVGTAVATENELSEAVELLSQKDGTRFLEVLVTPGSRSSLGRPKETPIANRDVFTNALRGLT